MEVHLDLRPVADGGIKRRPEFLLINCQPETYAQGSQTGIEKSCPVFF
jgi:hypothetical protein